MFTHQRRNPNAIASIWVKCNDLNQRPHHRWWFIWGKSSPFMAARFRLVNYSILPRSIVAKVETCLKLSRMKEETGGIRETQCHRWYSHPRSIEKTGAVKSRFALLCLFLWVSWLLGWLVCWSYHASHIFAPHLPGTKNMCFQSDICNVVIEFMECIIRFISIGYW